MDARTGMPAPQPMQSAWNPLPAAGRRAGASAAVVDPVPAPRLRSEDADDRLSVDPMRATDRYRLVMPYVEGV